MAKPVIATDLDEVLSPFVPDLIRWYNQLYQTDFGVHEITTYDFARIWGVTHEKSVEICNTFHTTRDIEAISPIDHSVETLSALKNHFDLVLVTSRPLQHEGHTKAWINRHFPNIFADIILCNHWTSVGKSIKKSEVCKNINAQYFIDDLPHYIQEVAECEIKTFLFGEYPWNQKVPLHKNVQRVSGWKEVKGLLVPESTR